MKSSDKALTKPPTPRFNYLFSVY